MLLLLKNMKMEKHDNSGRIKNTKRNILFGLLQFIVSQALPFVVRTILIYRLGAEYLGLNSLFSSILGVLSLMDFGFGTAMVYCMYKPIAEGDTEQICAQLAYYRKIYRLIGLAIMIAGLALIPFLKILIKDADMPGDLNICICYLVFLSDTVISYLLYGYLTAVPTAFQRRDILSRVSLITSFFSCAVRVIILLLSTNFYIYLLVLPVEAIVRNLIVSFVVRRRFPDIECRGSISLEQKNDLKKKVSGILINRLTNTSRNTIDSLCISAFIGLSMAGIYSNYYFVMSSILSCGIMVCHSMLASVGNSIAVENIEKNYSDMRKFDFIFMNIVSWATVCMLCLYQPFIQIWVKEEMMLGFPVVIGFCVYFYFMESGAIQWLYHQGAGLWWECRYVMVGEATANVLLNIALCKFMGVFGIVLATVLTVFVTNCVLCPRILFKQYFKNEKLKEYWTDHICYMVTMILTAGISWGVCSSLLPRSMVGNAMGSSILCLVGRLVVCTVLSTLLFWLIWHKSRRFQNAINWVKRLLKI